MFWITPAFFLLSGNKGLLKSFVVIFGFILIVYMIKIRNKIFRRPRVYRDKLPAEIWFYSKLLDIQIGKEKANSDVLWNIFQSFLLRKYKLHEDLLKTYTIFKLVQVHEKDSAMIDFYGDIYAAIENLKHQTEEEVLSYVKSIKREFNKGDITEFISEKKGNCNNC
ncbi:MAG: hypothetical protein CSB55_00645 [Candidatus Cloacimonadota bacterium]|nr:MAG: hypothetical protein CSB55_00645 [Candidatus Cloacimonadota bacterium]